MSPSFWLKVLSLASGAGQGKSMNPIRESKTGTPKPATRHDLHRSYSPKRHTILLQYEENSPKRFLHALPKDKVLANVLNDLKVPKWAHANDPAFAPRPAPSREALRDPPPDLRELTPSRDNGRTRLAKGRLPFRQKGTGKGEQPVGKRPSRMDAQGR